MPRDPRRYAPRRRPRRPETPPAAPAEGGPGDRRIGAGMLLALERSSPVLAGAIAYFLTHAIPQERDDDGPRALTAPTAVPAKVSVPRLVGMKEPVALVRLAQVGLRPKEVYRPTQKPQGVVVSQRPQQATRLAKGSQVTLVRTRSPADGQSTGPTSPEAGAPTALRPRLPGRRSASTRRATKVTMPDLSGMPPTRRRRSSTSSLSTRRSRRSNLRPARRTDRRPGAEGRREARKGSTVTLSVAKQHSRRHAGRRPRRTTNGCADDDLDRDRRHSPRPRRCRT